ncbi:hypothetical protein BST12_17150 [Mycobacterium angelicum]|uniref:Uncharacterized protein n=2 Tax=Mycobacterium angelicum TaxID=470074 RepID=A0A1W9ZP05_MYCAN|nr:hypothetical protein BST12_17150 [Mycobacterium angelicum]
MCDNAAEDVLLDGFVDFVSLNQVHRQVAQHNPSAAMLEIKTKTLEMIGTHHGSDGTVTEAIDQMNPAARENVRKELLLDGLVDYIDLNAVDWNVRQHNPSASRQEVQNESLAVIRSLLSEGLVVLGAMSGEGGRWRAWQEPLDASLQKISDVYVSRYDDPPAWVWSSWMALTDKGRSVAESTSKSHRFGQRCGPIDHFQRDIAGDIASQNRVSPSSRY